MNPQIKTRWLDALRSGEYSQTKNTLALQTETNTRYCCLGVLCEIAVAEGFATRTVNDIGEITYVDNDGNSRRGTLPVGVYEWAGLREGNPIVFYEEEDEALSNLNDHIGLNFNQIADIVEASL